MTESERSASLAVFPGSFDPITNGHADIIRRGLSVFDRVTVAILVNQEKKPLFSVEERVRIVREVWEGEPRVQVDTFSGLLVDYATRVGASVIVRGLRAISDFEYEFELNQLNRKLAPEIESVYVMASAEYSFLSSTGVKEIATFGGDIGDLVPSGVAAALRERIER